MNTTQKLRPLRPIRPARMLSEEAAEDLGFKPHDIPFLIRGGLLKPLGGARGNAVKYFARVIIEQLAEDVPWLDRATRYMYKVWQDKAEAKKRNRDDGEQSLAE